MSTDTHTGSIAQPDARHSARRAGPLRGAAASVSAAALGAAPHVLHHVGPLAGAALLAGATGTAVFGVLGLVLSVPLLRRLRQRTGSWVVPAWVLAAMAVTFTASTLVVGPLLSNDESRPAKTSPPPPASHEEHHR